MKNNSEIKADILILIYYCKDTDISYLTINSIQRFLYFVAVIYEFYSDEKFQNSPFSEYHFILKRGLPFSAEIISGINELDSDGSIDLKEDTSIELSEIGNSVTMNLLDNQENLESSRSEKNEWIKVMIHVLSLYGENKLFDFILRDPEYLKNLASNSDKGLDLDSKNETVKFLKDLKLKFEQSMSDITLSKTTYLELYFKYIFSDIITGNK